MPVLVGRLRDVLGEDCTGGETGRCECGGDDAGVSGAGVVVVVPPTEALAGDIVGGVGLAFSLLLILTGSL